ncbi:MAG TPA: biotin/lipoyl-binding protein, partial [Rhodanobacter sp.]
MFKNTLLPRVATRTLVIAITIACLLGGCSRSESAQEATPAFVRYGARIEVPTDSQLRRRLRVAAVELHQAPHELDFPATVEADPAHMANVLPALTGRVVELHVDLGQQVQRGQLLAVIDSGDLAQAYADVDKARDAL